eukprot:scaffold14142_cov94-Isochrysis_galbana.AAC.5
MHQLRLRPAGGAQLAGRECEDDARAGGGGQHGGRDRRQPQQHALHPKDATVPHSRQPERAVGGAEVGRDDELGARGRHHDHLAAELALGSEQLPRPQRRLGAQRGNRLPRQARREQRRGERQRGRAARVERVWPDVRRQWRGAAAAGLVAAVAAGVAPAEGARRRPALAAAHRAAHPTRHLAGHLAGPRTVWRSNRPFRIARCARVVSDARIPGAAGARGGVGGRCGFAPGCDGRRVGRCTGKHTAGHGTGPPHGGQRRPAGLLRGAERQQRVLTKLERLFGRPVEAGSHRPGPWRGCVRDCGAGGGGRRGLAGGWWPTGTVVTAKPSLHVGRGGRDEQRDAAGAQLPAQPAEQRAGRRLEAVRGLHVQDDEAHRAVVALRGAEDVTGQAGDGATEEEALQAHQVDGGAVAAEKGLGGFLCGAWRREEGLGEGASGGLDLEGSLAASKVS